MRTLPRFELRQRQVFPNLQRDKFATIPTGIGLEFMLGKLSDFLRSLENKSIAITVSDPELDDCPLIFVNAAFEEMTLYKRDQVLGRNCRFLQGADTDRNAVKKLRAQLTDTQSAAVTLTNYRADGTRFNNLIIIEPVFISTSKKLLFGCQYEFSAQHSRDEIVDHLEYISMTFSENVNIIDQSRQMVARSMDARSRLVFTMVRNYVSRQQIDSA